MVQAGGARSPGGLSLDIVLAAATDLVEREGAHALSMRALGRELGVEAMSLYRYVPNFDALVDGVVEREVLALLASEAMQPDPREDWRAFLLRQARGVRELALARPQVFPLVATRPTAAPWIRPPVRSLGWVELFLDGLIQRGLSGDSAVLVYRAFTSFLLGHLLLEVSGQGAQTGPLEEAQPGPALSPSLVGYPTIDRLSDLLAEDHAAVEFAASLDSLLERLTSEISMQPLRGADHHGP